MDHRFSKREYATSCIFTLFFTMLIAASFVDITLCPVLAQHSPINYLKTPSVFHEHFAFFPCHLLDLVLWIYFVLLVLFLLHKYRMYRQAKQHYFLLDYCYFHNAFVCLLVMLVVLKFAPIGSLLPPPQLSPASSPVDQDAVTSWRLVVDVLDASGLTSTWWRTIPVPVDIVPIAAAISPTKWIASSSSSLLSAAELPASTTTRAMSLFFLLLGGTMGPIVGAILMWDNALLFHSYDRMVSCYLHLAPAVAQGLVLHAAFVSHRRFVFLQTILRGLFFDAEFVWASWTSLQEWARKAVWMSSQSAAAAERTQRDWSQMFQERPSSSSSTSTSIFVSQQALDEGDISFPSLYAKLFLGHLMMFVVWQLCYHTFVEGRRLLSQRRQPPNAPSRFVEDHITAYTWLMEKPPLGKNGPLYRFVTLFGTGVVPTKILFSVAQCILHAFFMCIGAVPVYCSLFGTSTVLRWWGDAVWWGLYGRWVTLLPEAAAVAVDDSSRAVKWVEIVPSAQPVLWYTLAFTALCIYNAAKMNKKWIKKLQSGYVEKTRTSPVVTSEAEEGVPKSASKKPKKSQ